MSRFLLFALLLAWVAARAVPAWPLVIPAPGSVRLLEIDSYFHARHARTLLKTFPRIQRWDPSADYPHGQRGENQGGYDLLLAGATLLTGGDVLQVAAWAPLVLGTLALLLLSLLARILEGPWKGLVMPFLLVLYPGSLATYTLLGFADHHAFELFLAAGLCLGLVVSLEAPRRAWLVALPLVALLYSWPGAALYLLLLGLCLTGAVLFGARQVPRLAALIAGWVGLLWWLPTKLSPDLILGERYHRAASLCLLGLGLGVSLLAYGWERRETARGKALLAVVLLTLGGVLSLPTSQGMLTALLEPRPGTILEHRTVTWQLYWSYFGFAGLLAPLGLATAFYRREPRRVTAALYGALLIALWVRTRDFSYLAPAFVALLAALALAPWLRRAWLALPLLLLPAALGWTTPACPDTATLKGTLLLTPGWEQAAGWMRTGTPAPTLDLDGALLPWGADLHYPPGTYGVVTPWDRGHLVAFLAGRPVVWSATESREGAAWLATDQEEQALQELSAGCETGEEIRYVVLGAEVIAQNFLTHMQVAGVGEEEILEPAEHLVLENGTFDLPVFGGRYRRSIACRLFQDDCSGLSHFRLVYESPALTFVSYVASWNEAHSKLDVLRRAVPLEGHDAVVFRRISGARGVFPFQLGWLYRGELLSEVKVFQIVAGARVGGRAAPGQSVEASLVLKSRERSFVYRQRAEADADGRWQMTLPYATIGESRFPVRAAGPYMIQGRRLNLSESQVLSGRKVELGPVPP